MDGRDFEAGYFDGYDGKLPNCNTPEYLRGHEMGAALVDPVVVYHRTPSADLILKNGFRDGEGSYGIAGLDFRGVFVSNVPLDANEGASGEDLLEITVSPTLDLRQHELVQPTSPYREGCIPAERLNDECIVRLIDDEDEPG